MFQELADKFAVDFYFAVDNEDGGYEPYIWEVTAGNPDAFCSLFSKKFAKLRHLKEQQFRVDEDFALGYCTVSPEYTDPLVIPGEIKSIEKKSSSALFMTNDHENIVLSEGVKNIGDGVFADFTKLKTIVIPESIRHIGADAFKGCTSLFPENITAPAWVDIPAMLEGNPQTPTEEFLIVDGVLQQYYGKGPSVVIPDTVIEIKDRCFQYNADIKSVVIPESLQVIHEYAFDGCQNLEKLDFKAKTIDIQYGTFSACNLDPAFQHKVSGYEFKNGLLISAGTVISCTSRNAAEVTVPEGIVAIGTDAFCGCSGVKQITLPQSLRTLEKGCFSSCENLLEISLPDGVVEIPKQAFSYCVRLQTVTIPESVQKIATLAFYCCSSLSSVTVPDSVEEIENQAFLNCNENLRQNFNASGWFSYQIDEMFGMESGNPFDNEEAGDFEIDEDGVLVSYNGDDTDIVIPEGVKVIGEECFLESDDITSVVIPDSVEEIEESAFQECSSLETVVLSQGLKHIRDYAFCDTAITSIQIPESVEDIGAEAFCACEDLEEVIIPATLKYENIDTSSFYKCRNLKSEGIIAPGWTKEQIQSLGGDEEGFCILDDGILVVYKGSASDIVIPDCVKRIGEECFDGADDITSVVIPDSVEEIGKSAFYFCSSLETVVLSQGLKHIRDYALGGIAITSIQIPESVEDIGAFAFSHCKELEEVIIPATLKYENIGKKSFYKCSNLKYEGIIAPGWTKEQIQSLAGDEEGFFILDDGTLVEYKGAASDIVIPDRVKRIEDFCFYGLDDITSVVIPDSVEEIERCAFNGCSSLETVVLSPGLKHIREDAFYGTAITSIQIPESVEDIADRAFKSCENLKKVMLPASLKMEQISPDAFKDCPKLRCKNFIAPGLTTKEIEKLLGDK